MTTTTPTSIYPQDFNRVSGYTAARKKAVYLWRKHNTDKYNECQRKYHRAHYKYTPETKERLRLLAIWRAEVKRLSSIEI